jgi:peptide/nickel transport system substrate-binding protein
MTSAYWRQFERQLTRRRVLKGLGATGLVLASTACGGTPEAPPAAPTSAPAAPTTAAAPRAAATAAPQPKRGGSLRVTGNTWANLDPHQTNSTFVFGYGIGVYFSRLLKFKLKDVQLPAFIPIGDAAESWQQADDLTYIFKLRPNLKWQNIPPVNGRALTADDVIYSYDRQRTKGYPNASILDSIAKMEAVDKATVRITTTAVAADFLLSLASPYSVLVAREAVELKGDLKEGPTIGTGPFILDKIDKNGTSVARRNPDYYLQGQPYIDTYEMAVVPDAETQKAAFRAGNIELIPPGSSTLGDVDTYKRTNPNILVQMVKGLGSGTELGLKLDRPPFSDLRVRQAVYKAVDPQVITQTAFGSGWQSVGLLLPSVDWSLPEDEINRLYKRDVEGARRLLKEAGQESGFDFTLTALNSPTFLAGAELMAAQLKEVNLRATLKVLDYALYNGQVQEKGDFEAYTGPLVPYSSTDASLLGRYHSRGSGNTTGIKDPKLDQMIEKQTTLGRSPDERKKLLQDIQRYILDQAYVHFIQTNEAPIVLQPYVRDYFGGFGALNFEIDRLVHVWLDK